MKAILLILTMFLSFVSFGQDKVGHGSDAEGCDSAGVGTVTTWVKPVEYPVNCCDCASLGFFYKLIYPTEVYFSTIQLAKDALNSYRNNIWITFAGTLYKIQNIIPVLNLPVYKNTSPCGAIHPNNYYHIINYSKTVGASIIVHFNQTTGLMDYIEYY